MVLLYLSVTTCSAEADSEPNPYIGVLAAQMKMQQTFAEERIRSDGDSGLKQTRLANRGTKSYHSESFTGERNTMSMHDHSNYYSTVGLAELNMVMNGVEFKTRHNDYGLFKPATDDSTYNAAEEVAFPGVPPAVTDLVDIDDQVEEMRKWFKAWNDQDDSVRNYKDYFKPVLVYMEGAWTLTDDTIDEPFTSDRHSLDATSWSELHQKHYFTTQTGNKQNDENLAFLPTAVVNLINDSVPVLAQWNYRIACHPLNIDVPLNYLKLQNDLTTRLRFDWLHDDVLETRAARFQVKDPNSDGFETYSFLDKLMAEIPGKNNYGAVLHDEAMGVETFDYEEINEKLNAAYYHRTYKASEEDEMGSNERHRGFSDANLFMAMTDHPEIASTIIDGCPEDPDTDCLTEQRWSYAVPLEIIYLTPLNSWNPHDIEYKGYYMSDTGKTVQANGRRGGDTLETAYNGANSKYYYITPSQLFAEEGEEDAFDVGVLNREGDITRNSASGIRILFPNITGVGIMRQRYPIVPLHRDGSSVSKELEALKDIVLNPVSMAHHFTEIPTCSDDGDSVVVCDSSDNTTALLLLLKSATPGSHYHNIEITYAELNVLLNGAQVIKESLETYGHTHTLTLAYEHPDPAVYDDTGKFSYTWCDETKKCDDGHPFNLKSLTA